MPLRDHFHEPLRVERHWHSSHNAWATKLAEDLNTRLPEGYFAEPNVQFGIEIDVAAWEDSSCPTPAGALASSHVGGSWSPPEPTATLPFPLTTDIVEVAVYHGQSGPVLAGAIELVSPSNKDRAEHREAFGAKCRGYLHEGVGLVVIDVVTDRQADLHGVIVGREDVARVSRKGAESGNLLAAAYRPVERDASPQLDVWLNQLELGAPLPTMPLWLPGQLCLPIEFESTYEQTCAGLRIR